MNSSFSRQVRFGERKIFRPYFFTLYVWPSAQRMRCLMRRRIVDTHSAGAWMYGV
jgi:hypothetical protein